FRVASRPTKSSRGNNQKRGVRSPHRRIRVLRRHTLTHSEKPPGTLERFYRRLRLELIACSWLLSSPAITAGSVNRNVAPCPSVLFTKTRPPCIPTVSYTLERLMALDSVFSAVGLGAALNDRSKILLSTSKEIDAPPARSLKLTSLSLPWDNSTVIVPSGFTRDTA